MTQRLANAGKKIWWLTFGLITLAGFVLNATGYRHSLPYIDYPDEMTIWTMGRAYFDPAWTMFQPEYPPGLLVVSSTVQRLQQASGNPYLDPAGTIGIMRLTSVMACTVALLIIMLLANRMAGPIAGLVAGLCWLVLPLVDSQAKLATIDAWMCAWFLASIASGVEGWYRRSVGWIALSLLCAVIATLFKWQAAAALGMAGLACLTFWNSDRRRMIALIAAYVVIVGAFSYWVIFVHHALQGGVYLPGTQTSTPTLATLLTNLNFQVSQTGSGLLFGILPLVGLILAAVLPGVRWRLYGRMGLWAFPLVIVAFNLILSFNGAPVFARHYVAANGLLAVCAGIGITLILQVIQTLARRFRLPVSYITLGAVIIVALVLAFPLVDLLNDSLAINAELLRPDRRTAFAAWARATAIDGPLLITDPTVAAALTTLYGYQGRPLETPYNEGTSIYLKEEQITPQIISAKNIRYLVVSPSFDAKRLGLPLTRLITYDSNHSWRGDDWAAYYVGDLPQLPAEQTITFSGFGDAIKLEGYQFSRQSICVGDPVAIRLLWNAPKPPTRYYSFFLHLASQKGGELSLPINGQQPVSDDRPTLTWNRPDELLVSPTITWKLPQGVPSGQYAVWLGLFEPISGNHLTITDGTPHAVLTTLDVQDCRF